MARGKKKEAALSPTERLQAALVPESEQPYKVPENWCWVKLGASANLYNGDRGSNYPSKKDYQSSGIPFINAGAIVNGEIEEEEFNYISEEKYDALRAGKIQQGDILYCLRGSLGKTAIVKQNLKGAISSSLCILRTNDSLQKEFLYYLLCSNIIGYQQVLAENGSAQPNLSAASVIGYMIPLPPLPEQQRIVDRIENLFAKLDEAKQKAQDALDSFETRKAAILHKAFTGELTAQWRKEHDVGMESWENTSWGAFITSIEAGKNWNAEGRPPQDNEFGVVKVSAVTWGEFNENESKTCIVSSQWNEATQIHTGDFLFSRANTLQLVGNCVIVKSISKRLMLSDKILRFTFQSVVIPNFVLYYTKSKAYRIQVEQLASGNQDGMRNISQKNLKAIIFPVPKIEEQAEIVRILDDLLGKKQQAKEAVEKVLEQIDLTKKAILARAFRGELGTNDPSEESAVELLKATLQ